jgi:hypothetical protein
VGMLGVKALHGKVPATAVPKFRVKVCNQGYATIYNG